MKIMLDICFKIPYIMDRITINVIVMQTINAQLTTMEIYNGKKTSNKTQKVLNLLSKGTSFLDYFKK